MTKTFAIQGVVPPKHAPNTFEVEVTVMHGDADHFETLVIRPFQVTETEAMSSLIETLERLKAAYPHGRGGDHERYGYNNIEGFESWFGDSYARTEEEYKANYRSTIPYELFATHRAYANISEDETRLGDQYWPYQEYADIEASFYSYEVFYYDEVLAQHAVEVSDED